MGRELRGKLPSVPIQPHSEALLNAKMRDDIRKNKSKKYFDKRFRAKPSHIEAGDQVLLKQARKNKLTTTFDTHPYQVVSVKGTVAIIQRDNVKIMRNLSLLKKVPSTSLFTTKPINQPNVPLNDSDYDDLDFDTCGLDIPVAPRPQFPREERPQRPQRQRRPPARFADFQAH